MVMLFGGRVQMVKLHQHIARTFRRRDDHPPRHAQMHDQSLTGIEIGQNIFRPPPKCRDRGPRQPRGHVFGKRPAQIRAIDQSLGNARALQHGGKPATDCLDFWKFGQSGLSYITGGVVTR